MAEDNATLTPSVKKKSFQLLRLLKLLLLLVVLAVAGLLIFLYAFPERATAVAVNAERKRSALVRKEIDIPGGLHYVYLEGGQGEPLLLLHGFGANKDIFTSIARFLVPHYRVIVPDLVGFGESSHPHNADYTPLAQVERLRLLAQALEINKLHLGGSSMGGQIAASYAAKYPDAVMSLWLLGPAGLWSAPQSELGKILEAGGRNPLLAENANQFVEVLRFAMSKPPFIPGPILKVFAQERIRNYSLEKRIFTEIRGDNGLEKRLAGAETPALIVFGDHDRAINPATAELFHKLLPNSKVIIMADIGHLPMLEQPEQAAKDYLTFNAKLK